MTVRFANVQVSGGDEQGDGRRSAVVDAVAAKLAEQEGWERVGDPSAADRSVAVGPAHGGGWVGVYLDRADRLEEVESFGAALSEEVDGTAVGFRAEGTILEISLSRNGERSARLTGAKADLRDEDWSDFGGDEGVGRLRGALNADAPPDRRAREAAELLEMAPEFVAASYRYVQTNVAGDVDRLHVRRLEGSDEIRRVGGAPSFDVPDRVRELEASVGEDVQTSTSVGNLGGPVEGIRVEVTGSALDDGLVEVDTIRVSGGVGRETVERSIAAGAAGDGGTVAVTFDELDLAGALTDEVDLSDVSDRRGRELMRAHRASRMSVYARGSAVSSGDGTWSIRVEGTNDSGSDAAEATSRISVHPEPRMPARAQSERAPTHTLRQMERSGTLFAVAHFDKPIGAWMSLASDAMSRWGAEIATPEDSFAVVELENPRSRPDEKLEEAETFTDAERMAERIGGIGDLYQWSAVLHPEMPVGQRLQPERTAGFSYFSCRGPESESGSKPSPALGFWAGVEGGSGPEIEALTSRLRTIVDEFARSGRVLQALMTRWNWAPALGIRTLPYEIVCGLDSSGHLRVDWLRRYLRAATRDLWLGPSLWDRLDDRSVEQVAAVTILGEVRRLILRERATLDELERVLAPVLPGAEEWSDEKA